MAFAALLAAATPAIAEPNAQLVASVQQRLNYLGFAEVDARTLSTPQIAALHLELDGRALDFGELARFRTRQRVKVILGWD